MAFTFTQERKKQRYLILVLALVIFTILIVSWYSFVRNGPGSISPVSILIPPKIKINLEILTDPELDELESFEGISPLGGKIGRENPFVPY